MSTYLIIGSGSSFGSALSKKLSESNFVISVSRKDSNLKEKNLKHITIDNYLESSFSKVIDEIKLIDDLLVVFLNGVSENSAFYKLTNHEMNKVFHVNTFIPLILTRDILNARINKKTKYIYASSSRGIKGDKGIVIYSASKNAMIGAVKSLTKEYSKFDQEFYIFSLGLFSEGLANTLPEKVRKEIVSSTAIPKLVSENDFFEVLNAISKSSSMAGSIIKIDYGYT
jgi:short-subunit dehydrogenase